MDEERKMGIKERQEQCQKNKREMKEGRQRNGMKVKEIENTM